MKDLDLTDRLGLGELHIENTNIKTASGVSLNDHGKTLVGSVLDVSIDSGTPSTLQSPK